MQIRIYEDDIVNLDYITITSSTSNDGYHLWRVPDNIMDQLGDSLSFPEYEVRISSLTDSHCQEWSSSFRIAYNFLDFATGSSEVTVFQADEVELVQSTCMGGVGEAGVGMNGHVRRW